LFGESLFLFNGNFITLDPKRPRAAAMLVRDGRIEAVGAARELEAMATSYASRPLRRIDLAEKTVTPGFIDSHLHLLAYGAQLLRQADLVGSGSIEEVLDRLRDLMQRRGAGWIQGWGFDQDKLREKRFPTRQDLDRVSADRPIIVSRICGHAAVVNSAALALVSASERDAGDSETGLYTENDSDPFFRAIEPLTEQEMETCVLSASSVALRSGITSVQTLLDTPEQMIGYARLRRAGKLQIRVVGMPPYDAVQALHHHGVNSTFGDERLRFGACKLFSDGSLGAQTAWLAQPYADKPSTRGIRIYNPQDLKQKCADAQAKGFQIAIHAIGDQALRESLDAIEFALGSQDNSLHRHRIEHASVCPPDCMKRMAERKIIATLQPQFVTSDTWTAERVGAERSAWCYPFKSMLEAGVPISLSSDCPVEKLDAFAALASAVGRASWSPHQTLTPEQAINAYCLGSAYAAHQDVVLGSLVPGRLADFVVLSDDPTRLNAAAIAKLRAERVFINGVEIERDSMPF
jgi:predicted amidohydrolase YtcJ